MPVADCGGFRIDTGSDEEIARWVFSTAGQGLAQLARTIGTPGYLLKLCGSPEELGVVLRRSGPSSLLAISCRRPRNRPPKT